MSPYPWIDPAKPPFPTTRNRPFQFSVGIQSSATMLESDDGFRTILTRQCRGIWADGAGLLPWRAPPPLGSTNGPASTTSAVTIVVWGTGSERRLSQGVAETALAIS